MSIDGEYRIQSVGAEQLARAARPFGIGEDEAREIAGSFFKNTAAAFAVAGDEARRLPGLDDNGSKRFIDRLVDATAEYSEARGWIDRKTYFG
ncbi:hypothetical protein ACXR2T_09060 [Leucobacter sp. HY1910]